MTTTGSTNYPVKSAHQSDQRMFLLHYLKNIFNSSWRNSIDIINVHCYSAANKPREGLPTGSSIECRIYWYRSRKKSANVNMKKFNLTTQIETEMQKALFKFNESEKNMQIYLILQRLRYQPWNKLQPWKANWITLNLDNANSHSCPTATLSKVLQAIKTFSKILFMTTHEISWS